MDEWAPLGEAEKRGREERRATELAARETCQRRTVARLVPAPAPIGTRLTTGHSLDGDGA